jgi:sugar lactone lactonase YvrE
VATVAGNGSAGSADGFGANATFNFQAAFAGLAVEPATGALLVSEFPRLRLVNPRTGNVTTVSGRSTTSALAANAPLAAALYSNPGALAWDPSTARFLLVDAAGGGGFIRAVSVPLRADGALLQGGSVALLAGSGAASNVDGVGTAGGFNLPTSIAADGLGRAFIAQGNGVVRALAIATRALTTLAGAPSATGFVDGVGSAARFGAAAPFGDIVYHAGLGVLVYADALNRAVRSIDPDTGAVATLFASPPTFKAPTGLAWDAPTGSLLVADAGAQRVRRVFVGNGTVATVAGNGAPLAPGTPLPPDARRPLQGVFGGFAGPYGVAVVLGGGAVVVGNSGQGVASLPSTLSLYTPATGAVSYLAGAMSPLGLDGVGSAAGFGALGQVAPSALWPEIVYVAEFTNNFRVRRVNVTSRSVTALCGGGSLGYFDGPAPLARLSRPEGLAAVALDLALPPSPALGEVVYVTENAPAAHRVRACYGNGSVATVAAGGGAQGSADGPLLLATFNGPRGIAALNASLLFVAETGAHKVRAVNLASGLVSTAAGTGAAGAADGAASAAAFNGPRSVCAQPATGALFIVDTLNQRVRRLFGGAVATVAGGGAVDALGAAVTFSSPMGCSLDAAAALLYITDACGSFGAPPGNLLRVINLATGQVGTLAGSGVYGTGFGAGAGLAPAFSAPSAVALAGDGRVLVADAGLHRVQVLLPVEGGFEVSTLLGNGSAGAVVGASGGTPPACAAGLPWTTLRGPQGVSWDPCGYAYVCDTGNNRVLRVAPAGGRVDVAAGNGSLSSGGDGASVPPAGASVGAPRLFLPSAADVGPNASAAFVVDGGGNRVRLSYPVCGPRSCALVAALMGTGSAASSDADCAAANASIHGPMGLAAFSASPLPAYAAALAGGAPAAAAGPAARQVVVAGDRYGGSIRLLWPNGSSTTLQRGLGEPTGVAVGPRGLALFVVDRVSNALTRRALDGSGAILAAGDGSAAVGGADGGATAARFNAPTGLAVDAGGMVYIADQLNHRVRVASYAGLTVSPLAGAVAGASGFADGVGGAARFNLPSALAASPAAPLLIVADQVNNAIRGVSLPSGVVSTLLRSPGGACGFADGAVGGSPPPSLCAPAGVAVDAAGTVFIADRDNHALRALTMAGAGAAVLSTLVGAGAAAGGGLLDGPGALSRLLKPRGVALSSDGSGALLVADSDNNMLRIVACAPGIVAAAAAAAAPPTPQLPTASPAIAAALANITVSTLAGDGTQGCADGAPGQLNRPWGIAVNASGAVRIADQYCRRIRSLSSSGAVSSLSGTGAVGCGPTLWNNPTGAAFEPATGDLLVADFGCNFIRRLAADGTSSAVYGATTAQAGFTGVTVGGNGVIYVAHRETHRLLALPLNGDYGVFAGGGVGSSAGFLDAVGTAALFNRPTSVALDPLGNLVVADTYNARVRLVSVNSARAFTLAGSGAVGFLDGPATSAAFNAPQAAFSFSALGSAVIVADSGNSAIRHISPRGYVSTLAGASGVPGFQDGPGAAALLFQPRGLAFRPDGSLLATDMGSYIRLLTGGTAALPLAAPLPPPPQPRPNWVLPGGCAAALTTLAGTPPAAGATNGASGAASSFRAPFGVALDPVAGALWVVDQGNNRLRRVALGSGATSAVAGSISGFVDGYGAAGRVFSPAGLALDLASGSPPWAYVADYGNMRVRRVAPDGLLSSYAGTGAGAAAGGAAQVAATLPTPVALAFAVAAPPDASGALYVADRDSHTLLLVNGGGLVALLAGRSGLAGFADGAGSAALLDAPSGLAAGPGGVAFFVDTNNHALRSVTLGGVVLTLCGTQGAAGFDDGPCLGGAHFSAPEGVAYDFNASATYVSDTGNHAVRLVVGGWVSTLAGGGGAGAFADGPGALAKLKGPRHLAVDGSSGLVYIADSDNNALRILRCQPSPTPTPSPTPSPAPSPTPTPSPGACPAGFFCAPGAAAPQPCTCPAACPAGAAAADPPPSGLVWTIDTVAGSGVSGSVNGWGAAAQVAQANGLGIDAGGSGAVFMSDYGSNAIRVLNSSGFLGRLAGVPSTTPGYLDAANAGSRFNLPRGNVVTPFGLVVADAANNRLRLISINGSGVALVAFDGAGVALGSATTTLGGTGAPSTVNGPLSTAAFANPMGVAYDPASSRLYVSTSLAPASGADFVRVVSSVGAVNATVGTLAGNGTNSCVDSAIGTAATFHQAFSIALSVGGQLLYAADRFCNKVRVVNTTSGAVRTLAGNGAAGAANGVGTGATFREPVALAAASSGLFLVVAEFAGHRLRLVDTVAGVVSTLAGTSASSFGGDRGPAALAAISGPVGVAFDFALSRVVFSDAGNRRLRAITCALPSATPTPTPSATATVGASPTGTPTPAPSPTGSGSGAPSATASTSAPATPSPTGSGSGTPAPSPTPSASGTPSATASTSAPATPSTSGTPTSTLTLGASASGTGSLTPSPTPSPTLSLSSSGTGSASGAASASPSASGAGTASPAGAGAGGASRSSAASSSPAPPTASAEGSGSGSGSPSASPPLGSTASHSASANSSASTSSAATASFPPTSTPGASAAAPTAAASYTATSSSAGTATAAPPTATAAASRALALGASASATPTPSGSGSGTARITPSASASGTVSASPTAASLTPGASSSNTGSDSLSASGTGRGTGSATPSGSGTPAATPSSTLSASSTVSASPTPSLSTGASASITPSLSLSASGTPSPSGTGTPTPSATASGTGTGAGTPSSTPSASSTLSASPTSSLTRGASASNTGSNSLSGSGSGTGTPSATPTGSPTPSGTGTGSDTGSPTPSPTSTATAPPTPPLSPGASPSATPSAPATPPATGTPTGSTTGTPSRSGSGSPTGTPSKGASPSPTAATALPSSTAAALSPSSTAAGSSSPPLPGGSPSATPGTAPSEAAAAPPPPAAGGGAGGGGAAAALLLGGGEWWHFAVGCGGAALLGGAAGAAWWVQAQRRAAALRRRRRGARFEGENPLHAAAARRVGAGAAKR